MGMFSKKKPDVAASIELELDDLRARRSALETRRTKCESDLNTAIADRRHRLLEADVNENRDEIVRDFIGGLRDDRDGIVDAITAVDCKICEAQARLTAEQDRVTREVEAGKRSGELAVARRAG